MLNVDGSSKSSDILCHIVAEDDRSHGRLARTRAPHEQYLALLLALATLWRAHVGNCCQNVRGSPEKCVLLLYTVDALLSRFTYQAQAPKRGRTLSLLL